MAWDDGPAPRSGLMTDEQRAAMLARESNVARIKRENRAIKADRERNLKGIHKARQALVSRKPQRRA